MSTESARIWFLDSPWPDGHSIQDFHWSGRLNEDGSLWFDLHLETVGYDSEREPACNQDDDWHSPSLWCNFHNCTLSSTYWAEEGSLGLPVGSPASPFKWESLDGLELSADPAKVGDAVDLEAPPAFRIYLLGHDAVANHRVRFQREKTVGAFTLKWTGLIALAYAGDDEFKYKFRASIPNVRFEGFKAPVGMPKHRAEALLAGACLNEAKFSPQESEAGLVFLETFV